jgi:hypothetical protein
VAAFGLSIIVALLAAVSGVRLRGPAAAVSSAMLVVLAATWWAAVLTATGVGQRIVYLLAVVSVLAGGSWLVKAHKARTRGAYDPRRRRGGLTSSRSWRFRASAFCGYRAQARRLCDRHRPVLSVNRLEFRCFGLPAHGEHHHVMRDVGLSSGGAAGPLAGTRGNCTEDGAACAGDRHGMPDGQVTCAAASSTRKSSWVTPPSMTVRSGMG